MVGFILTLTFLSDESYFSSGLSLAVPRLLQLCLWLLPKSCQGSTRHKLDDNVLWRRHGEVFIVQQTHMLGNILFQISLYLKEVTPPSLLHGRHAVFHLKDFLILNIRCGSGRQGMKTLVIVEDTEICTLSHPSLSTSVLVTSEIGAQEAISAGDSGENSLEDVKVFCDIEQQMVLLNHLLV